MLLLQAALIFLNAVFAAAEIAVLSVNGAKLQKMAAEGNKKAGRLLRISSEPARFLSTIQVAITLSGFLGSAFAAENFSDPIVRALVNAGVSIPEKTLDTLAVIFITLVLSYVTLIFGELVPKRLAMKKAEGLSLGMSGLIGFVSKLFAPVVWLLTVSTNGILRLMGINPEDDGQKVGEEDILLMAQAGRESGGIDSEENEFIRNVFEFDDISAGDIATHRREVDMLWTEDPEEDWDREIHETRHSCYPVCSGSPDNVVGILNAKDYFRLEGRDRESVMAGAVRKPYFVPESLKADTLFRNMRRSGSPIAVVLDEHAGVVGIVTVNDLVEQLVGELGDGGDGEDENSREGIARKAEGVWEISGSPDLERIEEETGLSLSRSGCGTLTGLVFSLAGSVLSDGEQDMKLDFPGGEIEVRHVREHMVDRAVLRLKSGEEQ